MKQRIHIFGASGSGTTTIAEIICKKLSYKHFDSDEYYWLQTEDPFTIERPRDECLRLLNNDLSSHKKWILSGSITGWGDDIISYFDLVVFIYVPQNIRLARLQKREYERYGDEILPGGAKYKDSKDFIEWAAAYESGTRNGRSLTKHEAWLSAIKCPIVRIANDTLDESANTLLDAIRK